MTNYYLNLNDVEIKIIKKHQDCDYFKKNQKFQLGDLKPSGLCLAGFHSIIPYLHTLKNKGSFSWMKDRNKVIAQCPNPYIRVAFEINFVAGSQFKIKIIKIKGVCPEGHKINEVFEIDLTKLKVCYKAFDVLFPILNEFLFNEKEKRKKMMSCTNPDIPTLFELKRITTKTAKNAGFCEKPLVHKIKSTGIDRVCLKYHFSRHKRFTFRRPHPQNLCSEAYHACYPYCLALLYGASFKKNNTMPIIKCPGCDNFLKFQIIKKPYLIRPILKLFDKLIRRIRPFDITDSKIYIKVIEEKGRCPKGLKRGDEFIFNSGFNQKELCPAAFDNLYMPMHLLRKGIKVPWEKNYNFCIGQCPDHKTNVQYKIER